MLIFDSLQSSLELTIRQIGDTNLENSELKDETSKLTKKLEVIHTSHLNQLKSVQVTSFPVKISSTNKTFNICVGNHRIIPNLRCLASPVVDGCDRKDSKLFSPHKLYFFCFPSLLYCFMLATHMGGARHTCCTTLVQSPTEVVPIVNRWHWLTQVD